jgi:solute carrier family 25 (mitochondrial thiamine pyrophosphate transporter), member 19
MWQDLVHVVQKEGGIPALFRGNTAAIGLWVSYSAVQFSVYGTSKEYFQMLFPEESQRTVVAFGAGATAGVLATICTYPLDLCRTIFAAKGAIVSNVDSPASNGEGQHVTSSKTGNNTPTSSSNKPKQQQQQPQNPKHSSFRPPKSTIEFATNLYKLQGWKGFFAGSAPTLLQIVPYMGGSFAIYDAITAGDRGVSLSAYAGSIAGAVSKGLVYPMDTGTDV